MKQFLGLIFILASFASLADVDQSQTKTPEDDKAKIAEYNQECQIIDTLLVRKTFKVTCNSNYNFFGPSSKGTAKSAAAGIKIAGYNLLHPGTSKALFKDFNLVAKIMNQYDVVSTLEILGTVGHDGAVNKAVLDFLRSSPKLVSDLQAQKTKLSDAAKVKEINTQIAKLNADTQKAYTMYRSPGYFKLLIALKRLDPSWSLILSPRGDSALQGSVEEMVGYFFRANAVTPASNPHCEEFRDEDAGTPFACIANFSDKFLKKDYTHNFARRPFMATFRAGSSKFTMISNHVVFTFSGDEEASKKLMKDIFGVENPSDLSTGINKSNFARFAEIKMTLEFMDTFRKRYKDQKILYVGDTNLTYNNTFWPEILKGYVGGTLLIDQPTTVSPTRYSSDGKETNGVANAYDHFILDKSVFSGCDNGEVYNYYKNDINKDILKKYGMRVSDSTPSLRIKGFLPADEGGVGGDVPPDDQPLPTKLDYPMSASAKDKMTKMVNSYSLQLKNMLTIKNNEVVADDFQVEDRISGFQRRVFVNQLTNAFYFRFYQEILSDHFPVSMTCKF